MSSCWCVRGRRGVQESPVSTSLSTSLSSRKFFFSSLRISLVPGSFLQTKALESLKGLRVKLGERAKEIHTQGTLILPGGLWEVIFYNKCFLLFLLHLGLWDGCWDTVGKTQAWSTEFWIQWQLTKTKSHEKKWSAFKVETRFITWCGLEVKTNITTWCEPEFAHVHTFVGLKCFLFPFFVSSIEGLKMSLPSE